MNIKKVNLVLIITLLIFSINTFSTYQTSHAKYFKEKESLIYGLSLNKLYVGENTSLSYVSGTSYNLVKYMFKFNRSTLLKTSDAFVTYKVKVPDTCNIDSIYSNGVSNISSSSATIKYKNNLEDEITVYFSCNVDDLIDDEAIKTNFKVFEKYSPDNIEYLYTKGSDIIKLDEYYKMYPKPTGVISDDKKTLKIKESSTNKYETFITWINEYNETYKINEEKRLVTYIESLYKNEDDILNTDLSLKGLSVSYDSDNKEYTYYLSDDVLGYAYTYTSFSKYNLYFTDMNMGDDEFMDIMKYYLNTYVYPNEEDKVDIVYNYILNLGGIKKLINGSITIPGISYYSENKLVKINENILAIIDASNSSPAYAVHSSSVRTMISSISAGLINNYSFINNDVINYLNNNYYEFGRLWSKTGESFDEYFVITQIDDESDIVIKNPILFHIYSPYIESDESTHINYVTAYELISGMNITMKYNKDDITSIKEDLTLINQVTNKDITIDDDMFNISGTYNDYYIVKIDDEIIEITFTIE